MRLPGKKKIDGSLGHKVYKKPTPPDLYLSATGHHHPAQKRTLLSTLVHQAHVVSDPESLQVELRYLQRVFVSNGYSPCNTHLAFNRTLPAQKATQDPEMKNRRAVPPFYGSIR